MGFRNPITSIAAVDTRPGVAAAGVRVYQTTDGAGHPMGVVEFADGFSNTPAQLTSTAYYNADGSSTVGGSTRLKASPWQGVTPPELDLNIEGLPAGGYGAIARLTAGTLYLPADTRIGGKVLERAYYAQSAATAAQSLPSGVWTPINLGAMDYDTAGFYNPSFPTRLYAPVYGVYEVSGLIHWDVNSAGRRGLRYSYAQTSTAAAVIVPTAVGAFIPATASGTGIPGAPHFFTMQAGGWVEQQGFQDTGATLSTFVGTDSASMLKIKLIQPL